MTPTEFILIIIASSSVVVSCILVMILRVAHRIEDYLNSADTAYKPTKGKPVIMDHSSDPYTEAYEGDPDPNKRINTIRS